MLSKKLTIIIPTFNSEIYIETFMSGIMDVVQQIQDYQVSFLFVDDGSKDNTVEVLKKTREKYENISIIVLSRNFGQINAILVGLKYANADAYIMMSVDMQESPSLIFDFIKYWNEGYKMCIAYRKFRSDNFIRKIISKIFYAIIRIDKPQIPIGGFDYGLMDNDVANALLEKPFNFRFLQSDIVELGYKAKYIPCNRVRSVLSSSSFNFSVFKFNYFFDGLVNVIRIPFKVFFLLSLIAVVLLGMNLLYQIIHTIYFTPNNLSFEFLYPHLQVLSAGLILFLISFVIEFVYRIYDIVTHRKEYVIKEFIK